MKFNYSCHNIDRKERFWQRLFEILPGAISWGIIAGMTVLSFVQPLWASIIMVCFILYWVLRLLYMNVFLIISYMLLAIDKKTNWMRLISDLDDLDGLIRRQEMTVASNANIRARLAAFIRRGQLRELSLSGQLPPKMSDICHLVIFPVAKESREIIEPSLRSIVGGVYPAARVIIVVALEERAPARVKEDVYSLQREYRKLFADFLVSKHPGDISGESRVKGANVSWAARQMEKYFRSRRIPFDNVIVSCFDADTVAHREYLACLTYYFMITPDRTRASYQPIPVYHNNIWEVPSFARIIDIGTSFFQLIEATDPEKLVTFSSHSMSYRTLVDVGYWPVHMISDDSAIFWKSFIYYDGNYRVVPIYTTVSMDIAGGKSFWRTFVSIYRQKRRWAWGVENLPVVLRAFLRPSQIPLYKKMAFVIRLFDMFVSWATWSFLLSVITWLPMVFAGREFATSTIYYMVPRIKEVVFNLSFVGLLVCMAISLSLLPSGAGRHSLSRKLVHVLEWISIPVVILILSALPALDAQTRLMLGNRLEFQVTEKRRKDP